MSTDYPNQQLRTVARGTPRPVPDFLQFSFVDLFASLVSLCLSILYIRSTLPTSHLDSAVDRAWLVRNKQLAKVLEVDLLDRKWFPT